MIFMSINGLEKKFILPNESGYFEFSEGEKPLKHMKQHIILCFSGERHNVLTASRLHSVDLANHTITNNYSKYWHLSGVEFTWNEPWNCLQHLCFPNFNTKNTH